MKPVTFAPLDYSIIALFVLGILVLGLSTKLRENSTLQFIAAGRRLTLPLFVATLVSTWYGGILGIGEAVSFYGMGTWLLLGVPYYVFALLYAFVFARRVRGAEEISLPERLQTRFGRGVGVLGGLMVFLLAVPAAHTLMLGVLTQSMTGWGFYASLAVGVLIGLAFLYRGGLLADARVSLLAFAMMYVGFAVIVVYCLLNYPPGETLAKIEPPAFLTLTGGTGPLFILSFFILGAWTIVDPAFHQRVASAADAKTGQRGVLVSVLFWFISDVLLVTTGLYALALVKEPLANTLLYFPALGNAVLPPGLKAMFFCGMAGTILSATVGYTLVSGASFGRELIGRAMPGLPEATLTALTRVGLLVGTAIGIMLAATIQSVVSLWYSWAGAIIGALLLPVCASYDLFRLRSSHMLIGVSIAAAFVVSVSWLVYGISTGNGNLEVTVFEQNVSLGTLIPGLVVSALVLGVGETLVRRGHER